MLSCSSASSLIRTVPRSWSSPTMNGSKLTVAGPLASISINCVATSCPSSSRVTRRLVTFRSLWFTSLAIAVTCSAAENGSRSKATDVIVTFDASVPSMGSGRRRIPSSNETASSPLQPFFLKSEMRTTSRSVNSDCSRMLLASCSAGPKRVMLAPTSARAIAAYTLS